MKHLSLAVALMFLLCGCSTFKNPSLSSNSLSGQANQLELPIAQLGSALPAMKPGDERALKLIAADQMVENGYSAEAVELYREAESLSPRKAKLDLQLAAALASAGSYDESLARYERLLKRDKKNVSIINNYAYTLMESGNVAKAEAEFRRAIAIEPRFENAATNLGMLLAQQKRYGEALEVLVPVVGESAANHNLGVAAVEVGDEASAIRYFSKATSLPGSSKLSHEFLRSLSKSRVELLK